VDKITLDNINTLKVGDIIAKYPTTGIIMDECNTIKEVEINQSDITLLVIQNIAFDSYNLGYTVLGFSETFIAESNQSINDLVNGKWWLNVDISIFC
jgi:hypothetical protein